MIDLKNTNIILTRATGGIGNSILEKLITSGANVLATGTNEDKLKSIKEKYENVITEKFDISNHSEIGVETSSRHQRSHHDDFHPDTSFQRN